ncbi:SPFH domain-containing protein [Mucilaginibacter sp. Bleaf8]|uniref:SPFH domain-containing protein n=1 Tax=Mucilaginibacter sp. Bleaf8 TaxID=2834430 RepID=UPI001BCB628B|nr:SPFH domain-containing protein [Mucilaginibacter sp. Bleaf8]MBS7566921.1 SPFH domain-containing protein [Mucilaginibacter sp. Bleaf8]
MGIRDFFSKQFATVIEWKNQQPDLLIFKYTFDGDEIKNASKLIVAPGQGCILVYEGTVAEHITEEGIYELETANHPFITTLLKLRNLFESEHKLKIYYYRTAELVNQSWGTAMPVKYADPVYNIPVELGVNGNYSYRITNALHFFTQVVGVKDVYTEAAARQLIQSRIAQTLVAHLASAKLSYLQIDAELGNIAAALQEQLNAAFEQLGFKLTHFQILGTVFDKQTQSRISNIADVTAESLAAEQGGLNYVEMQKLKALRDAARNEGGLAGAGMQLGAGAELGKIFASEKDTALQQSGTDAVAQLQKLKLLLNEGIITQEEFDAGKKKWLDKL